MEQLLSENKIETTYDYMITKQIQSQHNMCSPIVLPCHGVCIGLCKFRLETEWTGSFVIVLVCVESGRS
jgi:hypothetical protein